MGEGQDHSLVGGGRRGKVSRQEIIIYGMRIERK
jgi:hypothetical protein